MEWFEIVITWLGIIVVAILLLNGWITGKSIEASRGSIPKEAMGLLELLVMGGLQLSRLTETTADDMAMERVARVLGYEIETTSGGLLLKRTPTMGEVDSAMYKDSTGAQGRADPPVMEAVNPGAKLTDLQEIPKARP
jgi:hypothetical protein